MKISVILPCRNEEKSIALCIKKIRETLKDKDYEIIVSDSSIDKSPEIAKELKTKVIKHNLQGYGNALLEGFKQAKGEYIIYADSDNTYNFSEIPKFIEELDKGYDLVIGSRIRGKIEKNAMPFVHRYIGTPIMNKLIRLFFGKRVSDTNSGFRAIKKNALEKLKLKTKGMEFASEMIIKAIKNNLRIKEIPVSYNKRSGNSKLRTINDGWLHLRFMLLYSPDYIFLLPSLLFIILGFIIMIPLLQGEVTILGITFKNHPMFIGSVLVILGYQLFLTWVFAKIYAHNHLNEKNPGLEKLYKHLNLEKAILAGLSLAIIGILIYCYILIRWLSTNLGALDTINISVFALTFIVLGIQTIFSGFFFSILGIKE